MDPKEHQDPEVERTKMSMKAVRIHEHGGPEVMRWEDVDIAPPGPKEVRLRHTAISLNFSDINLRRGGFYANQPPPMPLILGNEAAGVVEEIGLGVTAFRPGDRVVYAGMRGGLFEDTGAYAEYRNVPEERLIPIPEAIDDRTAATLLVKGLTAAQIIHTQYTPRRGDTVLVHAAASGVGLLLCQWVKHLGATVIGTVGSTEKARLAARYGCDHPVLYRDKDFVSEVRQLCPEGVAAVYDGVGKDTFMASFACVRPFARMINYGNASGHVPPLDIFVLAQQGSVLVGRPGLTAYTANIALYHSAAKEVFDMVRSGILHAVVEQSFGLQEAAKAHRLVERGGTIGAVVFLPPQS